jgi:hypothetical protein
LRPSLRPKTPPTPVFAENPDRPAFLGEVAFLQSKIQGELDAGENDAAAADEATLEAFDAPGFQ